MIQCDHFLLRLLIKEHDQLFARSFLGGRIVRKKEHVVLATNPQRHLFSRILPGFYAAAYATSNAGAGSGGGNLPNAPTHSAQQSSVVHPPSAPPSGVGYEKPYAA